MKVKVGIEPEQDVARVRAVREVVGPNVRLGVDANGGWSPRVAIQTIRRLMEFNIYFAEQPVPALDVSWLADVRRHVAIPIMADESVYTLQEGQGIGWPLDQHQRAARCPRHGDALVKMAGRFGPDDALYLVDYGAVRDFGQSSGGQRGGGGGGAGFNPAHPGDAPLVQIPHTGVIWKITRVSR